jgi:hypothetical protein
VAQVSRLGVRAPVYNLEVEGEHEYFANGIAVHNSWRYPEARDMLMFGLRLGEDPRVMVTTTPRPTRLIKSLVDDATVAISRGTTYQNRANLAGALGVRAPVYNLEVEGEHEYFANGISARTCRYSGNPRMRRFAPNRTAKKKLGTRCRPLRQLRLASSRKPRILGASVTVNHN